MRGTVLLGAAALALLGCQIGQGADEHIPAGGPPPIQGGTLEVTRLGGHELAVASDPARSSVFIVDLTEGSERHRVVLPDAQPGRIAILRDVAYVVLRRAGEIATIDLNEGLVLERREACAAPRGIDIDPDHGDLWVACAEGILVRMPPADGGPSQRLELLPDLRDVIAFGDGKLWVSRFRAAEILVVKDGEIVGTYVLPPVVGTQNLGFEGQPVFEPTVAWRMRELRDGRILLVHQLSQSTPIAPTSESSSSGEDPAYGGGQGHGHDPCGPAGVVRSAVSIRDAFGFLISTSIGTTLAVDGDVVGATVALAAASEPSAASVGGDDPSSSRNGLRTHRVTDLGRLLPEGRPYCVASAAQLDANRSATAVASLGFGRIVVQYRNRAELVIGRVAVATGEAPGDFEEVEARISLSGGSVDHLGHALFHEATSSGAACASCHPEGGDDGHVWRFAFGPRRSQHLRGGILDTAPFHWNGEHGTITSLFDDTFVERMGGGIRPREAEIEAFGEWLDRVPAVPGAVADAERLDRGRQIFRDLGCESCHSASAVADGTRADIGIVDDVPPELLTREFQVPALRDMIYRAPYLHDGSAETLEQAILRMPDTAVLLERDRDREDLIAYLRSL